MQGCPGHAKCSDITLVVGTLNGKRCVLFSLSTRFLTNIKLPKASNTFTDLLFLSYV